MLTPSQWLPFLSMIYICLRVRGLNISYTNSRDAVNENGLSEVRKKNLENNMCNRLLDHKYKIIFKFKRN
jgi:hypothetical protein